MATNTSTTRQTIDVRGKMVSLYVLAAVVEGLSAMDNAATSSVEVIMDDFKGLKNDLKAWGRLTGNEVREIAMPPEAPGSNETPPLAVGACRYEIVKTKKQSEKKNEQVAIIISQDGLVDVLSPLGFALAAAMSGMEVALYLQGPAVHLIKKGFQGHMPGWQRPFSVFARRGMADMGHVSATEKLQLLQKLGAKLYVCHPSMDVFGVKTRDLAFEDVIFAEYVSFLEVMRDATIKLYP